MDFSFVITSPHSPLIMEPKRNNGELASYFLEEILKNAIQQCSAYAGKIHVSSQPPSRNLDTCNGDSSPKYHLDMKQTGKNSPTEEIVTSRSYGDVKRSGENEDGQNLHVSCNTKDGVCDQYLDSRKLCSPDTDDHAHGKRKSEEICGDGMDMNESDITCASELKRIKPFYGDNCNVTKRKASQRDGAESNEIESHNTIVPMKRIKILQEDGSDSSILLSGRCQPGDLDSRIPQNGSKESIQPLGEEKCLRHETTQTAVHKISAEDTNVVEESLNETSSAAVDVLFGLSMPERIQSREDEFVTKECQFLLVSMVEQLQKWEEGDLASIGKIHTSDATFTTQPINLKPSCLQTLSSQVNDNELLGSYDVDQSGLDSVVTSTPDVGEAQKIPSSGVECTCTPFNCAINLPNVGEIATKICATGDYLSTLDAQSWGVTQGLSSVDEEEVNLSLDSDPGLEKPLLADSECGPVDFDIAESSFTCCFTPASELLSQDDREMQNSFPTDFNLDESNKCIDGENITGREHTRYVLSMKDNVLEEPFTFASAIANLKASEADLLTTTSLMQTLPQDPDEVIPILTHQELESMGSKQVEQVSASKEAASRIGFEFSREKDPTEMEMKDAPPYTQFLEEEYATVGKQANRSNVPADDSQAILATAKAMSDDQTVPSLATSYLEDDTVDMLEIEESIHSKQAYSHLKRSKRMEAEDFLVDEESLCDDTEERKLTVPDHLATIGQPLAGVFQWRRPLLVTDMTTYRAHPVDTPALRSTNTNANPLSSGGTIRPLPQCQRKMRVGLSKKQRINPLHARRMLEK